MDSQGKAAFIMSQVACMMAELAAMQAENEHRLRRGEAQAYPEESFMALKGQYGLDHNSVVAFLT